MADATPAGCGAMSKRFPNVLVPMTRAPTPSDFQYAVRRHSVDLGGDGSKMDYGRTDSEHV